jgi:hypothetical protein
MAYKIPKSKTTSYRTTPYNENELASFGKEKGLSYEESLIYAKFMKRRFPQEHSISSMEKWAERFKTKHPENYMDSQSLKIYKEVKAILD